MTVSTRVGMSSGQEPVFKHVSETFEEEKKENLQIFWSYTRE